MTEATLLPLDSFREQMGYHPFHFYNLVNAKIRVDSACNGLAFKYAWQGSNQSGREDILRAIQAAETKLTTFLGYAPAPHYREDTVLWPKFVDQRVSRRGFAGADGRYISASLPEGQVSKVGKQVRTLIGTVAMTYSDSDSDTITDKFTTTAVATTVTDLTEIECHFSSADRLEDVGDTTRIRPITVAISGGQVVVTGKSWLAVKPILYEGAVLTTIRQGLDPDTSANYVTTVDIYRCYINPNGLTIDDAQATLLWETTPCDGWWCCGLPSNVTFTTSQFDPAAVGKAVARVGIHDAELGRVIPAAAIYNATTGIWSSSGWEMLWHEPDRVLVRYQAGEALQSNGQLAPRWQTIIARLAAAELGGRICACDAANAEMYQWQFDLSRAAGANSEQYSIAPEDLRNPFGTRRGQVYAWQQVKRLALQTSHLI